MISLLEDHRMLFGFLLLIIIAVLSGLIAYGKVTEAESHGLMPLVTSLATVFGVWAGWAFQITK